ncbi:MAG TPA: hypothetical protein VF457_10985, partial [Burkholderiaceae bacterium]
ARYVCQLVADPVAALPRLPRVLAPLASRLARRWISAASGCDSDFVVEPSSRAGMKKGAPQDAP